MPDKKSQHFVPRFLLRQFAADIHVELSERRQINMINAARQIVKKGVSIKDQCARPYFYGKDLVIEETLGSVEGGFNTSINRIISTETLNENAVDLTEIVLMLALQKGRTAAAEEELNASAQKLARLAVYGKVDRDFLEKVRISINNAAALNVTNSIVMSPIMYDLKQVLIVNKTSTPFIISDNPVCTTNWFFSARMPLMGTGGIANAGIQVFMPISPKHTLLLLDNNVYSIGNSGNKIVLDDKSEIDHLNRLQFLNSFKNVYFNDDLSTDDAKLLLSITRPERINLFERLDQMADGRSYVVTKKSELDPPTPGVTRELIRMASFKLPECLRLKQIKIRPKPKYSDDGSLAGPMRDPAWAQIIRDFSSAMNKNGLRFGDLDRFVSRHPLRGRIGGWARVR